MTLSFTRKKYSQTINEVDPIKIVSTHEGAEHVLKKLSIKNKVVVYSNTPHETVVNTLKILKLNTYVD